jgi:hypothetical protein
MSNTFYDGEGKDLHCTEPVSSPGGFRGGRRSSFGPGLPANYVRENQRIAG